MKKSVIILGVMMLLVLGGVNVAATIFEPSLVEEMGDAPRKIVEKTYDSEPNYQFYGDLANENLGLQVKFSNVCDDFCAGECVYEEGFEEFFCYGNVNYLCAAYKVGDNFLIASSCAKPTLTRNWGDGSEGYAYTETASFSVSSVAYPGQLFLVVSKDPEISASDDFYLIEAPNLGWFKGLNSEKVNEEFPLSSFSVKSTLNDGFVGVEVLEVFDHEGNLIQFESNMGEKLLVGISSSKSITGNFLDSVAVYPQQKAVLRYGSYSGKLFVFVNGILEGELTVSSGESVKKDIDAGLLETYPDADLVDGSGNYVTPEKIKFKEIPLSPKPDKLSKELVAIVTQPTLLEKTYNAFKQFLSIWVPMFIGIFAILVILYLKVFKNKKAEKLVRKLEPEFMTEKI